VRRSIGTLLGPICWCGAFWILLDGCAEAQVLTGGIQIDLTPLARRYCHIVQFPHGWEFKTLDKPQDGPINFDDYADYEFRAEKDGAGRFLIGASITVASGRSHTTNWYRADLSSSQSLADSVSRETWEAASVAPLTRQSILSQYGGLEQEGTEFNGFHLSKTGAHWFGPPQFATRLSPESDWLVLQSWTENSGSPGITVFEDVFNSANGKKTFTIRGTYFGRDYPSGYLGMAGWVSDRYFILPLGERRGRCLVCKFDVPNRNQDGRRVVGR
jgi:hypothetical protein